MSNVKEVEISGLLPFNLDNDPDVQRLVGQLFAPSLGLCMTWGADTHWPNTFNGATCMYEFTITGQEAVSEDFLQRLVRTFSKHGPIRRCEYRDIELSTGWVDGMNWAGTGWQEMFRMSAILTSAWDAV